MFIITQYLKAIVPLENVSYISKEKVDDDGYSVIAVMKDLKITEEDRIELGFYYDEQEANNAMIGIIEGCTLKLSSFVMPKTDSEA